MVVTEDMKNDPAPGDTAVDAVVVGAGLAGLTAARELETAGASVMVIEAQDRVGGRTMARRVAGTTVEMGGQWIGPNQHRISALASSVGVETFPTHLPGRTVFCEGGRRSEYEEDAEIPFTDPASLREVDEVFGALGELARSVYAGAPWTAEKVAELDGQTLETWKLGHTQSSGARFYFDLAVESLYACEPRDVSLLGVLSDIASSGSFGGLFEIEASAEEYRFVGGAQELSVRMAGELKGRAVLGSPVRRIVQDKGHVLVESDRATVLAGTVIVTVPPALRGRIEYVPALPPVHDGLSQRMPMGAVIKCHAVYDAPFWREAGLNGRAESDTGPCKVTCDNSFPDGDTGVLTGFILGSDAREWGRREDEERERAVLDCFARYFGDEALGPLAYAETDWGAEIYSRGGYAGVPVPGMILDHGSALTEPVGCIHWAGTETASGWNGYMEGAVESGERAAREVLSAPGLRPETPVSGADDLSSRKLAQDYTHRR
ncbi:FAD-dependent oxidoreductase [soil metagenome]